MSSAVPDPFDIARRLAQAVSPYASRRDVTLLGLVERDGWLVRDVARRLSLKADALLLRALRCPGQGDITLGFLAVGSSLVLNEGLVRRLRISDSFIRGLATENLAELGRLELAWRGGLPPPEVHDRAIVLLDGGGAGLPELLGAAYLLRRRRPAWLALATLRSEREDVEGLKAAVDELLTPSHLRLSPDDTPEGKADNAGKSDVNRMEGPVGRLRFPRSPERAFRRSFLPRRKPCGRGRGQDGGAMVHAVVGVLRALL